MCKRMRVLILVLIFNHCLLVFGGQSGRIWHISLRGKGGHHCLATADQPCSDLGYALQHAQPGDAIEVDGFGDNLEEAVFSLDYDSDEMDSFVFDKSIRLVGINAKPRLIIAEEASKKSSGKLSASSDGGSCLVRLENLILSKGYISFAGCGAQIKQVNFEMAAIAIKSGCSKQVLSIEDCDFRGEVDCSKGGVQCTNTYDNYITCPSVNLTITKSRFYQTRVFVRANDPDTKEVRMIKVKDSLFTNKMEKMRKHGGLDIQYGSAQGEIDIDNTIFQHLIHPSHMRSIINLYEAALQIKSLPISRQNRSFSEINVNIRRSLFVNNERALTLIGPFKNVSIADSTFDSNVATHAGGAILFLVEPTSDVSITSSRFLGNKAGSHRSFYPHKPDGYVKVQGDEVHVDSDCCKGVIKMVGKGGALRIQRGSVTVSKCEFSNNTASTMGGSIIIDQKEGNNLILTDTNFSNSPAGELSEQGDIIYSRGKVTIENTDFDVLTAEPGLTVVQHFGDHWSMEVSGVFVRCPPGYNVRATNSTAYGITATGIRRSYRVDDLTYSCQACTHSDNYKDRGYLNYTLSFSEFSHYAFKINGEKPDLKSVTTGKVDHHVINCTTLSSSGRRAAHGRSQQEKILAIILILLLRRFRA